MFRFYSLLKGRGLCFFYVDMPAIISGETIAYLEPQEEIWRKESGRSYEFKELSGTDHLSPLDGIAGFSSKDTSYGKTLFRLPLRRKPSKLSDTLYTVPKVNKLVNALVSEAKFLLLFLRSVHTVQVYNIAENGTKSLSFETKIVDTTDISQKRATLLSQLKSCHCIDEYNISRVIKFTAEFDVSVYNGNASTADQQHTTSHWIVANQVGSADDTVRKASVQQMVFPWVGAALETDLETDQPENGRIFCFLPMPVEAASNLPVHINGTFGLTDNRRSLKWPGDDRKNDPTANWNAMLVKDVVPSCYVALLLASKGSFNSKDFYKVWPNVKSLAGSNWEPLLEAIFRDLLSHDVIFSEPYEQLGEWVNHKRAIFFPRGAALPAVVQCVLTNCGVKLAQVPQEVRNAFGLVHLRLNEVSAKLTRKHLLQKPHSYSSITADEKLALLLYCLSDGTYGGLLGLNLLPLSNGAFQTFQSSSNYVYLCTKEFPRKLLPNLEHKLVDLQNDPYHLHDAMKMAAASNLTQLRELTVPDIPTLLDESMPTEWRGQSIVHFPNDSDFPPEWVQTFWEWVKNKKLRAFQNRLILPVQKENTTESGHFSLVRLSNEAVLHIPKGVKYSKSDVAVLKKFGIHCCPQALKGFKLVAHEELKTFTKSFDSNGIFKALSRVESVGEICLAGDEANCLRKLLYDSNVSIKKFLPVLSALKIFNSASNSRNQIFSVRNVCQKSLLKASITLEESSWKLFDIKVLPEDIILLTSDEHHQKQLLKAISTNSFVNEVTFLTAHIFPQMKNSTIPERYFDQIMLEVLKKFDLLKSHDRNISKILQDIPFIKTSSGIRKCPKDLYDPDKTEFCQIFYALPLFPCSPYNAHGQALRECGLRNSIAPQDILDRVLAISALPQATPQPCDESKFLCAKAILKYVGAKEFKQDKVFCSLQGKSNVRFSTALDYLSRKHSWLPVLSSRPSGYSSQLPWKGEGLSNHLCCLDCDVCISRVSDLKKHSLLYGSQLYFTDPVIQTEILESHVSPHHLVAHLKEVIKCEDKLSSAEMLRIVQAIYSAMLDDAVNQVDFTSGFTSLTDDLSSLEKWIYIKEHNTFVSTAAVAVSFNPGFRHNLEPYLHKLPDSILQYSELFKEYGMNESFTEEQIISVLSSMRQDIENNTAPLSSDNCWRVVLAILDFLTENGTKDYCRPLDSVYVPIESDSEWPNLQAANEVVYIDNQFFKKFSIEENLQFLHGRVGLCIAKCLGIATLGKKLDISSDMFEDTGQYEPLTTSSKTSYTITRTA